MLLMGSSHLGSAVTQEPSAGLNLLLLVLQYLHDVGPVITEHWLYIGRNSSIEFIFFHYV